MFSKKLAMVPLVLVLSMLWGCSQNVTPSEENNTTQDGGVVKDGGSQDTPSQTDKDTGPKLASCKWDENSAITITLNGTSIKSSDSAVTVAGSKATITAAGTYIITGSLTTGHNQRS